MSDKINYRISTLQDKPVLEKLWEQGFHETTGFELYYKDMNHVEDALTATVEDTPVSVAYRYHNEGLFLPNHNKSESRCLPCPCYYAFSTDQAFKGKRIGMSLLQHILLEDDRSDLSVSMIAPADEGLMNLYINHFTYQKFFYVRQLEINSVDLYPSPSKGIVTAISPEEYNKFRNSFLQGTCHIRHTKAQMDYQNDLCKLSDGALYLITLPNSQCVAAIERGEQDELLCKELLAKDSDINDALFVISEHLLAPRMIVWMPTWCGADLGGIIKPLALLRMNQINRNSTLEETFSKLQGYTGFIFG